MQSALLPKGLCNKIDKMVRQFVWGSRLEKRKLHLLSWATMTSSTNKGNLGIKNMHGMNLAFMAKFGWRMIHEHGSLWTRALSTKYIRGDLNMSKLVHKTDSSNVWKGISMAAEMLRRGTMQRVYN